MCKSRRRSPSKSSLLAVLRIAGALVSAGCVSASPIVFNFDSDVSGKTTTFTDTVGGLSATFVTAFDPGGFIVGSPIAFSTLNGNVLFTDLDNIGLGIVFSSPLSSVSLAFATNTTVGVPFELDAYNGAFNPSNKVGSATATGAIPSGFTLPEGSISFSGSPFTLVVLNAQGGPNFAIDNVTANVSSIPEPTSLFSIGVCLGVLAVLNRRKFFFSKL
jgi:hypothetical protein